MRILNQPEVNINLITKRLSLHFCIVLLTMFTFSYSYSQLAPNAEYATFGGATMDPSGALVGMGSFNCATDGAAPDFEYSISGDFAPGDTSIPGPAQVIDNNGGAMPGVESIYGQADAAQNIEVEVAGFFGAVGSPISMTVFTTIDFASPTTAGDLAFILADVEQDQVTVCALDANGAPVPVSVVATWFQESFDADNSDAATVAPTWDTATATLVGQEGGGVQQTNYVADLPDNEAGAAWFEVNIPITQLQFKSQALGIAPDDPSQHFILASRCNIYDQAIIKEVVTPAPYVPGQDVTYDVTVCNQGNIDSGVLEVTDIIPAGMTLSTADMNGWLGAPAGPVTNNTGNIVPGACEVIPIILTIDPAFMGMTISNNVVISADNGDDIDSDPSIIAMLDDFADNNDLMEMDGGDDEDPELINIDLIYDLALIKTTASPGPFMPGDVVTFTIMVENQGMIDANNIVISDLIPADLSLSPADPNGWVGPAVGPVTNTIAFLPAGALTTIDIDLVIDPAFAGGSIVNNAEISADDGNDVDSTPGDSSQLNDFLDDNDLGETDGGDDEDPEEIIVEALIFDLALTKTTASAGPFVPGGTVTFDINVFNQGTADAFNIALVDVIPAGLILNDPTWTLAGGTATLNMPIPSIPAMTGPVTVPITFTIDPAFMGSSIVNDAEILAADNDMNPGNAPPTDVDSTPGDNGTPVDQPNNDDTADTAGGDDQDPEEILIGQVYDLALIKEEASVGPYSPGDDVTYTITVENQGTLDAGQIAITDFIPTGMTLSLADGNGWAGPLTGPVTNTLTGPTVAQGAITVDIILTIDPAFMGTSIVNFAEISSDSGMDVDSAPDAVNGNDAGGLENSASDDELMGDGTGAPGDPVAATDEDDHDPEEIELIPQVFDLALIKEESSVGPYAPGDDVTYTITVCNQGNVNAANISIVDFIPVGMMLSAADGNGWTGPFAGPVNNAIAALPAGACTTLNIILTIDATFAGGPLVNFAEISGDSNGNDIDSTPDAVNGNDAGGAPQTPSDNTMIGDGTGAPGDGVAPTDEDDHDPELIEVVIFDLALTKTLNAGTPGPMFVQGDLVTFDLTVFNQGTLDAFSIGLLDQIPAGLVLADANWTAAGTTATLNTPIGFIPAGGSTVETITFMVDGSVTGQVINDAEISSADDDTNPGNTPPTDVDSAPGDDATMDDLANNDDTADTTGGDDQDPEPIMIGDNPIFDLALTKTLSAGSVGPFMAGDLVTFDLTVFNQGSLDAFLISLIDIIPAGLTLADSGFTAAGSIATLNTPIPFIPAGGSAVQTITFLVDGSVTGPITNDAEISSADDDTNPGNMPPTDIDSTPGDDDTPTDLPNNDDIADMTGGDDQDPEQIVVEIVCEDIAGVVFIDANEDGCDIGDAGAMGITVELFDCNSPSNIPVAVATTAADGSYTFGPDEFGDANICLPAGGAFMVVISNLPPMFTNTTGAGMGCPMNNDDSPANDGMSLCVDPSDTAPGAGEGAPDDDNSVDFGIVPPPPVCEDIAGVVFVDANEDGCDIGDAGAMGITVELFDCNTPGAGPVATATTGADGSYSFGPAAPGAANICLPAGGAFMVVISNLPPMFTNTTGAGMGCPMNNDDSPANDGMSLCVDPSDTAPGAGEGAPDDDNSVDFGIVPPPPVCEDIAGVVFIDANEDGCDIGDAGAMGITVELFDCNSPSNIPVAVATTAADGSYTFGPDEFGDANICLPAGGAFMVVISNLPPMFTNTTGAGMGCPMNNDDSPANDGMSLCVDPSDTAPGAGEGAPDDDNSVDFGIVPPPPVCEDIAGVVFIDANEDGCDIGDAGAMGITVELFDCNTPGAGPVATATTAADGSYSFGPAAPGAANICLPAGGAFMVVISNLPPMFTNTTGAGMGCPMNNDDSPANDGMSLCVDPSDTAPGAGEGAPDDDNSVDFGIVPPPPVCEDIAGVVFIDANEDGCDIGDAGAMGITVELFDCNSPSNIPVAVATTAADGSYAFGPNEFGDANICLPAGGAFMVVISNLPPMFTNTTGAGMGCPMNNDDSPANDGMSLCVDPSDTAPGAGEGAPDDDNSVDFGIVPPPPVCEDIAGVVFVDANEDGCDIGDAGAMGITVELFDCNTPGAGPVATATTGADGSYSFGPAAPGAANICLPAGGAFMVVISNLPPMFTNTTGAGMGCPMNNDDSPANDGMSLCVDPSDTAPGAGEGAPDDDNSVDFGIVPPPPVCEDIAGVVFIDANEDGCDIGDAGAMGITVELFDCNSPSNIPVAVATTAADGSYTFGPNEFGDANICLPAGGAFMVVISNLPPMFTNTTGAGMGCPMNNDDSPANDGMSLCVDPSDTAPGAGEGAPDDDNSVDFGIVPPPPVCEDIAGVVFVDANEDGCNIGDVGAMGITVELFDCNTPGAGPVATATTGADGSYAFGPNEFGDANICLPAGGAFMVVISNLPPMFTNTTGAGMGCPMNNDDSPANDGMSLCVDPSDTAPGAGEGAPDDDNSVDFGIVPPPPVCEDIAGVVFVDANEDGCNIGDVGAMGITVELFDCNNPSAIPVAQATTGADGSYAFGPNEFGDANICLPAGGAFMVVISNLPPMFTNTTGAGMGCPMNNDDSPANDGMSLCVDPSDTAPGAGEGAPDDDNSVDFGIVPPPPVCEDIAGTVFVDANEDGCNIGDAGAMGITVELFDCNNPSVIPVAQTTTGADGSYTFGPNEFGDANICLPAGGSFMVVISNLPPMFTNTTGAGVGCPMNNDDSPANDGMSLCVDPSDTAPGAGEGAPNDDNSVDFGIVPPGTFDLALVKQVDAAGPFALGADVPFTITVFNQGTIDAANIVVADNIPAGLSLSVNDTNGWTPGAAGSVTNTIAFIPAGGSSSLSIILTVDANFTGSSIINNAEIIADNNGNDVDSTPGDNSQPDDMTDDDDQFEVDGGDDEDPELIEIVDPKMCDELICNGDLQISLNVACLLELTPDQLLEKPHPGVFTILLFDEHDNFLREGFLTAEDAGNTVRYQISCNGNSCWGEIIVEANIIPQFNSPCEPTADGTIPPGCVLWCGPDNDVPAALVTPEEVVAAFGDCGPDLIGEINVERTVEGDICSEDGEVVTLVYTGKVLLHDQIQTVDILTQVFSTQSLDISDPTFSFPRDVILDCDYLDNIEVAEGEEAIDFMLGEPASIFASTGSGSLAFPNYINVHDTVLNIITISDTAQVVVDQILRDTMVQEVIDGELVWVLKTIVDKVTEDVITERFDTIGMTNPIVPIVDRVCNVLSGFSDVEFDACGQGRKIIRTWNLIDWCDTDVTITARQTIEIIDLTPPQVVQSVNGELVPVTTLSDVTTSIEPWACSAIFNIPELMVIDNCDEMPLIDYSVSEGVVNGNVITDLWLDQSPISVVGTVSDDCGNATQVGFNIIVVDDVPPVPVCETSIQVSLTGNVDGFGIANVDASVFDEGSHDSGCGKVTITAVRLEDWREVVRDCQDNIVGFAPTTCAPITSDVDLGAPAGKDGCDATGVNIAQITQPGESVKFCCDDFGQIVQVILFVEDEAGNVNQCVVDVQVVDQTAPTLICQDLVVSCADGDFLAPPAMAGATCERESPFEVQLLSESRGSNVCAGGQTVREWFIDLDNSGDFSPGDAFCQQIVSVDADTAFDPNTIKWPRNFDGDQVAGVNIELNEAGEIVESPITVTMGDAFSCVPDETEDFPVWCDTECGLIGFSVETDTIRASDACLKIIRSWTIVDWCTFDPNGSGIDDENDTATDSFEAVEDWAQSEPDFPGCPAFGPDSGNPVYFRYTSVDPDGFYTYDQIIVVNDDSAPEIDAPATFVVNTSGGATSKDDPTDCTGSNDVFASASDLCGGQMTGSDLLQWTITVSSQGNVVASRTVRGPEASMNSQVGSPGDVHIITWRVEDGCGNQSSAQTVVTFDDQQAPTPFCVAGLTTAFMASDGSVTVWGAEFDFGSFDNCTDVEDLRFSIVRRGEQPILPGEVGFESQTGITFHCSDFTSFEELDVYVFDEVGNGDFCTVGIVLADNGSVCDEDGQLPEEEEEEGEGVVEMEEEEMQGASFVIAGQVRTSYGEMIDGVDITAEANALSEYPLNTLTDENGEYAFNNNPINENYRLTAQRDDDFMNGVSTLDLVLISRHIIDMAPFEDPFTILAADASGDGRVSALDLAELRRLILGISEELPNNQSWVFVDANQQFLDPANPFPFFEEINISALSQDRMTEDFIGVKIGDVNASFKGVESRSSGILTLQANNEVLVPGQLIDVAVTAQNFNQVAGYQFTLSHEGLTFNAVQKGALDVDETSIGIQNDRLSMVWFSPETQVVDAEETLFTLTFEANTGVTLSESLSLNSSITRAEAYVGQGLETYGIDLLFGDVFTAATLYQNQPNPFEESTSIGFDLPKASEASIVIFDIAGKELKKIKGQFAAGYNTVTVEAKDLNASGVLYYQLQTGSEIVTKKMIAVSK